jgi:hypothetical protein
MRGRIPVQPRGDPTGPGGTGSNLTDAISATFCV